MIGFEDWEQKKFIILTDKENHKNKEEMIFSCVLFFQSFCSSHPQNTWNDQLCGLCWQIKNHFPDKSLILRIFCMGSYLGHFVFGPGVLACATHGGGRSEAGHCFHLLFSFFFFFSAFYFSPTSENLPCVKICFPQYFGITRRNIYKKNRVIFFFCMASARSRSLDQPLVPGVLIIFLRHISII